MATESARPYYTDSHRLYVPKIAVLKAVTDLAELERMFVFEFEDRSPLGHQPGQFVMVSLWGAGEIPISLAGWPADIPEFELAVRRVGRVTEAMFSMWIKL